MRNYSIFFVLALACVFSILLTVFYPTGLSKPSGCYSDGIKTWVFTDSTIVISGKNTATHGGRIEYVSSNYFTVTGPRDTVYYNYIFSGDSLIVNNKTYYSCGKDS